MMADEAQGDKGKRRSKSRRRRRRKIKDSSANPAALELSSTSSKLEKNLNAGRRWFSMYDVFRCKQLQIQLSTTAIPRSGTSLIKPDDPDYKPLITTEINQAPPKIPQEIDKKQVGLVNDTEVSHSQKKLINVDLVLGSESESSLDPDEKQKRSRKNAELLRRMEMVRRLQSDNPELQQAAAAEIRAAARRDGEARTTLALMGAIPPLVSMLDSPSSSAALAALLNLAVRNDPNKAAIVAAGAVPKIIKLMKHQAATATLLSLSALDSNKPTIAACSGALQAIIAATHGDGSQSRRDAMGALFNLSLCPANAPLLCGAGAVPAVLRAVYDSELTPRAVAAAANLASTQAGRRALAREEEAGLVFLDVLSWSRCGVGSLHAGGQVECAAYVVMLLAQCSGAQRRAMARAGCSSVLLELVLVGSPEVQERASRALQFLDEESSGTSSSYCCSLLIDEVAGGDEQGGGSLEQQRREAMEQEIYSEERRAVNRLVQQSLQLNMQRITKRACIPFASQSS